MAACAYFIGICDQDKCNERAAPAIPVTVASNDNVANAHNDELQIQRSEDDDGVATASASAAEATLSTNAADAVRLHHGQDPPPHCRSSLPSPSQPTNELSSSAATVIQSRPHNRTIIPSSLNPSSWSKRRTRIVSCGCLSSAAVCTIRLQYCSIPVPPPTSSTPSSFYST